MRRIYLSVIFFLLFSCRSTESAEQDIQQLIGLLDNSTILRQQTKYGFEFKLVIPRETIQSIIRYDDESLPLLLNVLISDEHNYKRIAAVSKCLGLIGKEKSLPQLLEIHAKCTKNKYRSGEAKMALAEVRAAIISIIRSNDSADETLLIVFINQLVSQFQDDPFPIWPLEDIDLYFPTDEMEIVVQMGNKDLLIKEFQFTMDLKLSFNEPVTSYPESEVFRVYLDRWKQVKQRYSEEELMKLWSIVWCLGEMQCVDALDLIKKKKQEFHKFRLYSPSCFTFLIEGQFDHTIQKLEYSKRIQAFDSAFLFLKNASEKAPPATIWGTIQLLNDLTRQDFVYDPKDDEPKRKNCLEECIKWCEENRPYLIWSSKQNYFVIFEEAKKACISVEEYRKTHSWFEEEKKEE